MGYQVVMCRHVTLEGQSRDPNTLMSMKWSRDPKGAVRQYGRLS